MGAVLSQTERASILLVAGEASGDARGAELIRALRRKRPNLRFCGMGGDRMAEAGMRIVRHARETAFLGFFEVARHFPLIRKVFREMTDLLDSDRPDLAVLIDYPGFNLRLARQTQKRGIRTVYYISPQIWAWGRNRIQQIRRTVDHMIVLFPFEETFYREAGVPVTFTGHPLKDHFEVRFSKKGIHELLEH